MDLLMLRVDSAQDGSVLSLLYEVTEPSEFSAGGDLHFLCFVVETDERPRLPLGRMKVDPNLAVVTIGALAVKTSEGGVGTWEVKAGDIASRTLTYALNDYIDDVYIDVRDANIVPHCRQNQP